MSTRASLSVLRSLLLAAGIALVAVASGCEPEEKDVVRTGAEVLVESDFQILSGEDVGLLVNHTARVDTSHLIDRVHGAPNVDLVALFGPEHGLRGTQGAGASVRDGHDAQTGVPVYSLYDDTRRPTPTELEGLNTLVFDVQDVGARFYTYITTMGRAMQAAARAGVRFVVLDRPNPLGGTYVSGFMMEPDHESFVGRYPIPIAHGLTVGEMALLIKGENLLPGLDSLDLKVVRMQGWNRTMQWPDTHRKWTPPSPNIPTWETALVYPGTCFFEAVRVNEGRGTDHPFLQIGLPWTKAAAVSVRNRLRSRSIPGVAFDTVSFTPTSRPGAAASPRFEGDRLHGVQIEIVDRRRTRPVELGMHALHATYQEARRLTETSFVSRPEHLTRLAGTDTLQRMLQDGVSPDSIIRSWREPVARFRSLRAPYLLYSPHYDDS